MINSRAQGDEQRTPESLGWGGWILGTKALLSWGLYECRRSNVYMKSDIHNWEQKNFDIGLSVWKCPGRGTFPKKKKKLNFFLRLNEKCHTILTQISAVQGNIYAHFYSLAIYTSQFCSSIYEHRLFPNCLVGISRLVCS